MKKQAKQGTLSLSNPFKETGGEKLLQYIWQFGYYNKSNLQTSDGESITVVSPGTCNKNQGPDFLNARVKIGNTILAGNIELHLQTSDWKKHQHESDQTYKNVVLHVVYEHNEKVNHCLSCDTEFS